MTCIAQEPDCSRYVVHNWCQGMPERCINVCSCYLISALQAQAQHVACLCTSMTSFRSHRWRPVPQKAYAHATRALCRSALSAHVWLPTAKCVTTCLYTKFGRISQRHRAAAWTCSAVRHSIDARPRAQHDLVPDTGGRWNEY
jgi:hypothetical protein